MKKYVSEFIGTFALTFFACGVAVVLGCNTVSGIIGTSLAFGLVIIVMAYSIGQISGCHLNPAVSIAMMLDDRMDMDEMIYYIVSQLLGAFAGSLLLGLCLGDFTNLGANSFGGVLPNGMEVTPFIALAVESILSFIFILVILTVTSKKEYSNISGIIIGLTLVLVHLIGISFTGTSVNPARSIAPAFIQGGEAFLQVWLFVLAPIIGGLSATLFYNEVIKSNKK